MNTGAAVRPDLRADLDAPRGLSRAVTLQFDDNALLPLLVAFTGLLPSLVAGSVVVEVLFALPGMGRLLADAAAAHDYPMLVAGVLVAAAARLLALLAADIIQYRLDPRLRAAGV